MNLIKIIILLSMVFQSCLNKPQDNLVLNITVDTDSTIDYEVFITEHKKKLDSIQDSGIHTIYLYNSKNDFTGSIQFLDNDSMYYIGYYTSGEKWVEGELSDYKMHGKWSEYFKTGNLKTLSKFKYDTIIGDLIAYHENGTIFYKTSYENGVEDGIIIGYHYNGKISFSGQKKKGTKVGEWKIWTESGELIKVEHFNNGELVKVEEY
ncbi:MAG: hypothetical protein WD048_03325 [Chitinophagales bacterium]